MGDFGPMMKIFFVKYFLKPSLMYLNVYLVCGIILCVILTLLNDHFTKTKICSTSTFLRPPIHQLVEHEHQHVTTFKPWLIIYIFHRFWLNMLLLNTLWINIWHKRHELYLFYEGKFLIHNASHRKLPGFTMKTTIFSAEKS